MVYYACLIKSDTHITQRFKNGGTSHAYPCNLDAFFASLVADWLR